MKEEKAWAVLGIEPTDDADLIRDAYRSKLVDTNPEDDPEGFMELKEAYDTAIGALEKSDDEAEERPYADVIAQIDELYKDINKRMDPKQWKPVLSQPVFASLDDQDALRNEFLRYTMSHYKYPGEVLKLLDNVFTFTQDEAALIEVFPQDFITFFTDNIINDGDYVLSEAPVIGRANGVKEVNDVAVEYHGEPSEKAEFEYAIDEYISTLNQVVTSYRRIGNPETPDEVRANEIESLAETILQLREYDYYHPYEEIAVIRYLYYTERYDECFKLAESRIKTTVMTGEKHSDFYYSHLVFMYLRFFVQDVHKDMGLTIDPDVLEKCAAVVPKTMNEVYVNETHPAMSLITYLKGEKRRAAEYMSYAIEQVNDRAYEAVTDQIDKERLEELPGMIEAEPDNLSYKISYAWILSRNEQLEEALKVLESVSDEDKEDMEYNNIMGRLLINQNKYDESIPYLTKWNELLTASFGYDKELDKNALPIEDVRQITRVPYSYYLISAAQLNTGDLENAKKNVLLSLQGAGMRDYYSFADLYNFILYSQKAYDEGLDFWTKEVEKDNNYRLICRGNRQYMAHMAGDARSVIEDYFVLRNDDPMYVDSYVFAEDVYVDYNDAEGFDICLKYIERADVHDVRLDYNLGRYYRTQHNPKEAIEVFKGVEAAINEGYEGIENQYRFYVSYGYALMDFDKTEEAEGRHDEIRAKIKELVDKGLELYPDSINIYWLNTDYCERYTDEADSVYKIMLEKFPDDPDVNYEYGRYLYNQDRNEEAGRQFETGHAKNPDHVGLCYELSDYYNEYMYKEKELSEYNQKAIELTSRILDLKYDSRAAVHYALNLIDAMKYEEALEFCEKAVQDFPDAAFVHNAQGLCYMYLDRFEESEACFKKAIEVYQGTGRFVSYTNLVKLYQRFCKFDKALEIYKEYTDRFSIDDIPSNEKYGELYEDLDLWDDALNARMRAYRKKLVKITGNEEEMDADIKILNTLKKYPDMPIHKFGGIIYYLRRISEVYAYMGDTARIEEIADDIRKYMDFAEVPDEEMTDEYRDTMHYDYWAAGNHFVYTLRSPEDAIKYFRKYIKVLKKNEDDLKTYYEDIASSYDLMSRSYCFLGDTENAALCANKALEYIELGFGSVEQYLGFKRSTPLRACRISGLYYWKGNREEAMKLLDMTDKCLKCTHCVHTSCADKIDRLALIAEIEGDYEKAIEYYKLGQKIGGTDIERTPGIRECLNKLGK
ncbi:MAG: tetratricopeptide repeat protein [Eubacterium sp.]|nr:tetratricopeptide repeat protein [Eubacterium sp.]